MLLVDYMTPTMCEDMIRRADADGEWGSLSYDKFPAQEIRLKKLGLWEELQEHWNEVINPIIEHHWKPTQMYGMRDAFVMRYSLETQKELALHTDASLVTGSVKLNDDYEGGELIFPRQKISNKNLPIGKMLLFPGAVTHGHACTELLSGVKYSLTMWTSRYEGDVL
jgi:predicted 2-oxoglutarate/Fe(II)-dependent dioxygenase YbiX